MFYNYSIQFNLKIYFLNIKYELQKKLIELKRKVSTYSISDTSDIGSTI